MTDIRTRIAAAIARVTDSKAAAEVIAEIARTHALVPLELIPAIQSMIDRTDTGADRNAIRQWIKSFDGPAPS